MRLQARPQPIGMETLEPRRLFNLAPFGADVTFNNGKGTAAASDQLAAPDGKYVIAHPTDDGLQLQRFNSSGEIVGRPITAVSNYSTYATSIDSAGVITVAYTVNGAVEGSGGEIDFVRINRSGAVSAPVTIQHTSESVYYINATATADGAFFVSWAEYNEWSVDPMARAYDAAGNPRGPTFAIDPGRGFSYRESMYDFTTVALPDGSGLRYAYLEDAQDEYHQNLRFGTTSLTSDLGDADDIGFVGSPQIAMNDDGSFVMAYATSHLQVSDDDPPITYMRRFDAHGSAIGSEMQIGDALTDKGKGIVPTGIARLTDGGYILTYAQDVQGTNRTTLYAQRFDASLRPDNAGPVDYYADDAISYRVGGVSFSGRGIAVDEFGNAVVTYVTTTDDVYPGKTETHVTRLTTNVAALDNGTLWVLGTRKSDSMSVKQRGGSIFANLGKSSMKFAASRVRGIDMEGSNGNDRIFNETSIPSTIRGGSGSDVIQGGADNDLIRGNAGDDDLSGNDGNDELIGDNGNDVLVGNNGNDKLDGGSGRDRVYGYAGNDSIFATDGEIDQLFGNSGRDTFNRDGQDSVVD